MTWWQTLLIAAVPALITALALLAQLRESRRHALELRRDEASERATIRRADTARAVHVETLALMTAALNDMTTSARYAREGFVDTSFHATLDGHIRELRRAYAQVVVACSPDSASALARFTIAVGDYADMIVQPGPTDTDHHLDEVEGHMTVYLDAARVDIDVNHAAPPASTRRWRGTASATWPS